MGPKRKIALAGLTASFLGVIAVSQLAAQPRSREHTVTESSAVDLQAAIQAPVAANKVTITIEGNRRIIRSNSVAEHATGQFPNSGNPNTIQPQAFEVSLPLTPQKSGRVTEFTLGTFGVAVNGVLIEPQAAEWYLGDRDGGWQYDPLGGAVPLGLDEHHAHVQPGGKYHYHGLPTGLLADLGVDEALPSPLIGWAMDGFPIYALYAEKDGTVQAMSSSYRLKQGHRPSGGNNPGGHYDGTFLQDWEYLPGVGDLDACNGTTLVTAEFPQGVYAYFLTDVYPYVPRCFSGTPVESAIQQVRSAPEDLNGGQGGGPGGGRGDAIAKAAAELGVSADALRRAVGPPPPDFTRAARQLGIDEERLRRVMQNARR